MRHRREEARPRTGVFHRDARRWMRLGREEARPRTGVFHRDARGLMSFSPTRRPWPSSSAPVPASGGGADAPEDPTACIHRLETEVRELRQKVATSERALIHTEKLQALGQLISGVAHELANPLTAMIARATLIQGAKTLDDARRHAEVIEAQGQRATKIVRNLSSFARRRASTRAAVSLNSVAEAVVELHGYQLTASQIELVQDLQPDLPAVDGDPHELEQVLLNLIMNAQHAMVHANGRGRLTIATRQAEDFVRLSVEDDGPGMPKELLSQIFKPFFSTKGEGGTGLGLAIVRDLITRHGGRIWPESVEGIGTRMIVELPRVQATVSPRPDERARVIHHGRGVLLVVDDEPDIGELIADLVRRRGYEAEYVESAEAALSRLRSGVFRGILTDLRMPDMDGATLWETIRRERPTMALRTIFMTGDHAKPETAALLEATGQPCLTKPFRADELDEALASLERMAEETRSG
jgi:two-component system NtrC family sensor kinase